ncbi:MAG TPA: alpha/beta fold hydrolase [Vicinamibacterales bacterium]|nr:alpha/beta fold hydrolase [Vicinamibacterales bacterium]
MTEPVDLDRRDLLKRAAALATVTAGAALTGSRDAGAQQSAAAPADTLRFFPAGFTRDTVKTSGATINVVRGGDGPPLLLVHGAPQSHVSWTKVAPDLAKDHTLVMPDLRGYGDSSKPEDGVNHANYSKRAMALDLIEVMKHYGYDRFAMVGHDRGGRVGQRLALDHPGALTHLAVLDIVPTYYLYTHVTIEFVQAYFHWFNYLRRAPGPENDLLKQNEAFKARATDPIQVEWLRTASTPENIHAMCEDYRAGASIDLEHDRADIDKKITCPLVTLWGEKGAMGRIYDVLAIWKERGTKVTGKGLPGGHNLMIDVPDQLIAEVRAMLKTA